MNKGLRERNLNEIMVLIEFIVPFPAQSRVGREDQMNNEFHSSEDEGVGDFLGVRMEREILPGPTSLNISVIQLI